MSKPTEQVCLKPTFSGLKARQRAERDDYPETISLRVHRALSWLGRAEQCDEDDDAQFIFLWIAFNAAYANELDDHEAFSSSAQQIFRKFIDRLVNLDHNQLLSDIVWEQFPCSIRVLLDNKHVFRPFWDYQSGKISESIWKEQFITAKADASKALSRSNTQSVLTIVFSRLYMLRNQLMHGGATWNSKVNRDQVRDCTNILEKIVPVIILIMMDNPNEPWGKPYYPPVD